MPVLIAMLRAVNLAGRNKVKMEALRELCGSLKFRDARTHLQSGNVVFRAGGNAAGVALKLENAIEQSFGFRSSVIVRTPAELAAVISKNPFAGRDVDPSRLLVYFLAGEPAAEACSRIPEINAGPEELHLDARELFIHFPNGMGQTKLSLAKVERMLETSGTGRNWNTVTKLLEIAESLSSGE